MVDITNVVNVSLQAQPRGLGFYNVNNLMMFTDEAPVSAWTESYRVYTNAREVETDFGTSSNAYALAQKVFAQTPNLLAGGGQLMVAPMQENETLAEAISRVYALVYFGGVISAKVLTADEAIAASDAVQTLNTLFMLPSNKVTDLEENGLFATIIGKNNTNTKCILYTMSQDGAYECAAAYAGRGYAVNYSAQNSCLTMNLKDLSGIVADTGITQTVYNKAQALGVDVYCSVEGLPKVVSNAPSGGLYFDQMLNRLWFVQTSKVTLFNVLAQTSTKIPQTEAGMNTLKNALKKVAVQAVYNGFLAAGTWNSSETFGNQEDFLRNIEDYGYYIYSMPISQQLQADREARKAPVMQFAGKEAGAIHSASLLIYFEA